MTTINELKAAGEAPAWMEDFGLKTLQGGYLLKDETPKMMYRRAAKAAAARLKKPHMEEKFFDVMWKNWLCPATPILVNMGTDRGLPISCYANSVPDSLDGILMKNHELGMLAKHGGGVGTYYGRIRGRGSPVKGTGGISDGVPAWAKINDSTIHSVNQGSARRGAAVGYLPIRHPDIDEFLSIRKPTGDANSRCFNLHHGVCIEDEFMEAIQNGDTRSRELWQRVLTERFETGEPYLFFTDNVNRQLPQSYINNNLKVETSNLCNEIYLYTDPDHTFVCCLSSLNLARWDEWKDTDTIEISIEFLDAVMEEYIQKAKSITGMAASVRFAEKSRALGLGVLGWHTLLQKNNIPFDSMDAMMLNGQVFRTIRSKADVATRELAVEFGEPEWCKGTGVRNTHLLAIAPTVSNSTISGNLSAGIEPLVANSFVQNSSKGTFIRKNGILRELLASKGKDTDEVWRFIDKEAGSVQSLPFLSAQEKEVFLTARELNQFSIIRQAGQRQKWIDQGQSINLFFGVNSDPKYIHEVHMEAWKAGLKGLYYCRTESVLRADMASRDSSECKACEA